MSARWLVFNLPAWEASLSQDADLPITLEFDPRRPWAVVSPCHAGCSSAHKIAWDGTAFPTWIEAMDAATRRKSTWTGGLFVMCGEPTR